MLNLIFFFTILCLCKKDSYEAPTEIFRRKGMPATYSQMIQKKQCVCMCVEREKERI